MANKIILLPSKSMDENKKEDRDEHMLVRLPKKTREHLVPNKNVLDVQGEGEYKEFSVFHAFKDDIKSANELVKEGIISEEDLDNIGFVSSKNFALLGEKDKTFITCDLEKRAKEVVDILIGTDPELLLMHNGHIKHANEIPGFSKMSKFGHDGAMAELRPDPEKTPEKLTENIIHLFQNEELINNVKDFDWISACYHEENNRDYPVGAHIHFDNPVEVNKLSTEQKNRLFAVTNKVLDELLTVPMVRLDGNKGHFRRARCKMSTYNNFNAQNYGKGYGFFGEWRSQKGHLEHRSLSGMVLVDPDICTAVFGTAKAIVEAVYKSAIDNDLSAEYILPKRFSQTGIYKETFANWNKIPLCEDLGCITSSAEISGIMNKSSRTEISAKYIKQWLNKLRGLSTYDKAEKYVEVLGDVLSSSAKVLDGMNPKIKEIWR